MEREMESERKRERGREKERERKREREREREERGEGECDVDANVLRYQFILCAYIGRKVKVERQIDVVKERKIKVNILRLRL